jgi:hypothetical protein
VYELMHRLLIKPSPYCLSHGGPFFSARLEPAWDSWPKGSEWRVVKMRRCGRPERLKRSALPDFVFAVGIACVRVPPESYARISGKLEWRECWLQGFNTETSIASKIAVRARKFARAAHCSH